MTTNKTIDGEKPVEYLKSKFSCDGSYIVVSIPVDKEGKLISDKSGLIGVIRPEHRPAGVKP